MYTCVMCKRLFDGEPAMKNGAGSFCSDCKQEMYQRSVSAIKDKKTEGCIWCGRRLTTEQEVQQGACRSCEIHREWLLRCIRRSDHPYKYVDRVEKRESENRKQKESERKAQEKEKRDTIELKLTPETALLSRVDSIENTLGELLGMFKNEYRNSTKQLTIER